MSTSSETDKLQECEKVLGVMDLPRLLSKYTHFQETSGDLIGDCPFHIPEEGSHPTLVVKLQTKKFHCIYPRCHERGSIIELIAKFENCDVGMACNKILDLWMLEQPVVQDTFPFAEKTSNQKDLPEYSQTQLRLLRQCPLRFWNEYVKDVRLDKQTVESTIGTLIHSALQAFYHLPATSRKEKDLFALFTKSWGKGYGPQDDREYWLQRALAALENAYNLNLQLNPLKIETETTKSIYFPLDTPRYKLKSKADRVDWYSQSQYCLIDYKWDEKPLPEKDAIIDFQTVFYYLTWIGAQQGVPPTFISYQFLTPGLQIDLVPTASAMEMGIVHLLEYLEKAESLKAQTVEPEATRNNYCYNCKLYGKCPATKGLGK
jgi:hypothetical protein